MAMSRGLDSRVSDDLDLYRSAAVQRPTVEKVRTISKRLGFDLSEDELKHYTVSVAENLAPYDLVYRLVEPKPPVKYPRGPGYRPIEDDNPYNAWHMKTDVRGASSGILVNKTVAIKDSVCVAGVPMMAGSKLIEGYTPEFDATVVTRILDAGGVIVGTATCESLCMNRSSFSSDTGPVPNPRDATLTSGGSSSGCAALLAAKLVDVAIGGDQGGSIRLPAAWCGVVGLKPTWGLVPYTGAVSLEPTVDHLGPIAQTVTDCALLLEAIAGFDGGRDPRQPQSIKVPEYSKLLTTDLTGVRVGVLLEAFANCESGIEEVVRDAACSLTDVGAIVEDVTVPMHTEAPAIYTPVVVDGLYQALFCRAGAGPSAKGFHPTSLMNHLTRSLQTRSNELSQTCKLLCVTGEYLRETTNHLFYARASNLIMTLTDAYDAVLKDYDVIVMPTSPTTALKLPTLKRDTDDGPSQRQLLTDLMVMGRGAVSAQNTCPFNATGHPAISVPAGCLGGGPAASPALTVGLQIVGNKWHEADVLKVAYAWEAIRKGREIDPIN